jgi:hypothetical protein
MSLANLVKPVTKAKFEYPAMPGFEVELAYLTRDELQKIRNKCVSTKIDRRTRKPEEEVDNELFEGLYYKAIVTGWKGLKRKYLPKLGPFELDGTVDPESDEIYEPEGAVVLMQNSPDFNAWVSDQMEQVENFTMKR